KPEFSESRILSDRRRHGVDAGDNWTATNALFDPSSGWRTRSWHRSGQIVVAGLKRRYVVESAEDWRSRHWRDGELGQDIGGRPGFNSSAWADDITGFVCTGSDRMSKLANRKKNRSLIMQYRIDSVRRLSTVAAKPKSARNRDQNGSRIEVETQPK